MKKNRMKRLLATAVLLSGLSLTTAWAQQTMLVYSIALIIVIMFRPRGIMGTREFALCDVPKWPGWIKVYFTSRAAGKAAQKEAKSHG